MSSFAVGRGAVKRGPVKRGVAKRGAVKRGATTCGPAGRDAVEHFVIGNLAVSNCADNAVTAR